MQETEYENMFLLENTHWWYRGLHDLVERRIRTYVKNIKRPITLFDAGCGTGRMMEIARKYGKTEGIDYSPEAVKYCVKRGLATAKLGDLNTWNPNQELFDIILSLDVLCHSAIVNEEKVLCHWYGALKKQGIVIVNLPAFELLRRRHDTVVYTRKRYTKNELVPLFERCGFTIVQASYRLPQLFFIFLIKKYSEKYLPASGGGSDLKAVPSWLNSALFLVNSIENIFISSAISLPLGGSLFVVAQK